MGAEITKLKRFEHWPILLSKFLQEKQGSEFVWGQNDCSLFVADCINALTGFDCGAHVRGTYSDADGARKVLTDFGGMFSMVESFLGDPRPYPMKNMRGDIVMHDFGTASCLGVIDDTGRRAAFLSVNRGLIREPISNKMIVWGY